MSRWESSGKVGKWDGGWGMVKCDDVIEQI